MSASTEYVFCNHTKTCGEKEIKCRKPLNREETNDSSLPIGNFCKECGEWFCDKHFNKSKEMCKQCVEDRS